MGYEIYSNSITNRVWNTLPQELPSKAQIHSFLKNACFGVIQAVGDYLTVPFSDAHSRVTERLFSMKFLLFNGTNSSGITKVAIYAKYTFSLLVTAVEVVVTTPLALGGWGIKSLNTLIFQKNISIWYGNPSFIEEPEKINVLSWDICGEIGGFPIMHGGMLPVNIRHDKIVSKILDISPDVVLLNSVSPVEARRLYRSLKGEYAQFCVAMGDSFWKGEAGYFVAAKFPISEPKYISFKASSSNLQNQGFFVMETNHQKILFTKLSPKEKLSQSQLKEIKDYMDDSLESNSKPFLIMGNLNIDALNDDEEEAYQKMLSLGMKDCCSPAGLKDQETTTNLFLQDHLLIEETKGAKRRVDYVVSYSSCNNDIEDETPSIKMKQYLAYYLERAMALSNHHALTAEIG